jgi:hypothetical protein
MWTGQPLLPHLSWALRTVDDRVAEWALLSTAEHLGLPIEQNRIGNF